MPQSKFQQNINLDVALIRAALNGMGEFYDAAMKLGFESPDAAAERGQWYKRQSKKYKDAVTAKVVELEAANV